MLFVCPDLHNQHHDQLFNLRTCLMPPMEPHAHPVTPMGSPGPGHLPRPRKPPGLRLRAFTWPRSHIDWLTPTRSSVAASLPSVSKFAHVTASGSISFLSIVNNMLLNICHVLFMLLWLDGQGCFHSGLLWITFLWTSTQDVYVHRGSHCSCAHTSSGGAEGHGNCVEHFEEPLDRFPKWP